MERWIDLPLKGIKERCSLLFPQRRNRPDLLNVKEGRVGPER